MKLRSSPLDKAIGKTIKQRRIEAGLTQTQVGRLLGVSFQMVQKYENGDSRLGIEQFMKLSKHLGFKMSDVLGEPKVSKKDSKAAETLVHNFNKLNEDQKDIIQRVVQAMAVQ